MVQIAVEGGEIGRHCNASLERTSYLYTINLGFVILTSKMRVIDAIETRTSILVSET